MGFSINLPSDDLLEEDRLPDKFFITPLRFARAALDGVLTYIPTIKFLGLTQGALGSLTEDNMDLIKNPLFWIVKFDEALDEVCQDFPLDAYSDPVDMQLAFLLKVAKVYETHSDLNWSDIFLDEVVEVVEVTDDLKKFLVGFEGFNRVIRTFIYPHQLHKED